MRTAVPSTLLAAVLAVTLTACPSSGGDPPVNQNNNAEDGGTEPPCGPSTCAGCCDATGACVGGTSELACGTGGLSCGPCGADQRCATGFCVDTPPACTPSTCGGCCDGDVCQSGTADVACGAGGFVCEACGWNETCQGGVCVEQCGPTNCSGCCDVNGDCVEGSADYACGAWGDQCSPCGQDEACSLGVCVDVSCQATCGGCCSGDVCLGGTMDQACGQGGDACQSCGPGRACIANGCAVDPTSRWDVYLVGASLSVTNGDGDPWDIWGGLPDPYVRFTAGGVSEAEVSMQSSVQNDTITPVWDAVVLSDVSAAQLLDRFCYEVWDSDADADDSVTSRCFALTDQHFNGALITQTASYSTVQFRLELH